MIKQMLAVFVGAAVLGVSAPAQENQPGVRLIDASVDVLVVGGSSTEHGESLEALQGGAHDPKRRGFTLQQAELSLSGAIDPYFIGETHAIFSEDGVELEEAFIKTTSLPGGLEIKAGLYLTEFGRMNATHPHAWAWIDQPVINSRLLGPEGARSTGARAAIHLPLPWFSELIVGVQNADNASLASFLGEADHHHGDHGHGEAHAEAHGEEEDHDHAHADEFEFEEGIAGLPRVGGDSDKLVYSIRLENGGDLTDTINALFGLSAMYGPNTAGDSTMTTLFGADLTVKWRPVNNQRGYPFIVWQTELMHRDYETDALTLVSDDGDTLAFSGETLKDSGFYSQILYGLRPRWEIGFRGEYAWGKGEGLEERDEDSRRDDRLRLSPLVQFRPSEFSRVRLQYNYDKADFLAKSDAHTVWLGGEFLFGTHPAHKY